MVIATALDDKPLATSERILVQVMTREQPLGFRTSGGRIDALGSYPFGVERPRGELRIEGRITKAIALDENGYAIGRPESLPRDGRQRTLTFDGDRLAWLLTR